MRTSLQPAGDRGRGSRQIPAAQQNDAAYECRRSTSRPNEKDLAAAGQHLEKAVQLAPNDPQPELELAEFQLRSDDAANAKPVARWPNASRAIRN